MKTVKRMFVMPLLVAVFAISAAFATQSSAKEEFPSVQGYINTPVPCTLSKRCGNTQGPVCTYNGDQLFGKNSANDCSHILYMPWQN